MVNSISALTLWITRNERDIAHVFVAVEAPAFLVRIENRGQRVPKLLFGVVAGFDDRVHGSIKSPCTRIVNPYCLQKSLAEE